MTAPAECSARVRRRGSLRSRRRLRPWRGEVRCGPRSQPAEGRIAPGTVARCRVGRQDRGSDRQCQRRTRGHRGARFRRARERAPFARRGAYTCAFGSGRGASDVSHRHRRVRGRAHGFVTLGTRRPVPRQTELDQENVQDDCRNAAKGMHITSTNGTRRIPRSSRGAHYERNIAAISGPRSRDSWRPVVRETPTGGSIHDTVIIARNLLPWHEPRRVSAGGGDPLDHAHTRTGNCSYHARCSTASRLPRCRRA